MERAGKDVSAGALLVALLLGLCGYYGNLAKDSYMDDYRAFYVAAEAVHAGLDPYVNHVDVDEKYADGLWVKADSRWLYPPTALLFVAPLRVLGYKWSKTAWGTLMALAMAAVLWRLGRRLPGHELVLVALFLTMPMVSNIDNGQVDCAILGLVLLAFYLQESVVAGVCLGVAIAVKFAPVLLLLWFVGSRRWRTVVWSLGTFAALAALSLGRWGTGYWREFWMHVRAHVDLGSLAVAPHVFTSVRKIGDRFMVTNDGVFSYQHDFYGYMQNPLRFFGHAGGAVGMLLLLGFGGWLFGSVRGKALGVERGFFLFLAVALLANPLLWPMGLVACFPLTLALVASSERPHLAAILLLVPLFLTKQEVGNFNFTLWLVVAGWLVWRNGWLRVRPLDEAMGDRKTTATTLVQG